MNRLARYLFVQTFFGVVGAAAVITAVIILIDFVETSRDIATRAEISPVQVMGLTALKAPLLIQETLPFIMLFGTLWTFFRLNRRSELIVMRASGYSAWRILTPAVLLALTVGIFGSTLLNPVGAKTNARFELIREELLEGRTGRAPVAAGPVWLRETTPDGYAIITATSFEPDEGRLEQPVFRVYMQGAGGEPELDRRVEADSARLGGGFWSLDNAIELTETARRVRLGDVALPTSIGRQALFERARSPGGISFWQLPGVIASAREAGLSTTAYELRLQELIAQPLTIIAAALLAVAATLRLVRLGGATGFALAGGAAGFLLYFLKELMMSLGAAGTLEPVSAAWSAPALFVICAMFYIAHTEDG